MGSRSDRTSGSPMRRAGSTSPAPVIGGDHAHVAARSSGTAAERLRAQHRQSPATSGGVLTLLNWASVMGVSNQPPSSRRAFDRGMTSAHSACRSTRSPFEKTTCSTPHTRPSCPRGANVPVATRGITGSNRTRSAPEGPTVGRSEREVTPASIASWSKRRSIRSLAPDG